MHILAFAASNSSTSINARLAGYALSVIQQQLPPDSTTEMLDLHDFEMPIYRSDRQAETGIPQPAKRFYAAIGAADALIISFAEHNGSYSSAYKNLFDWTSRIDSQVFQGKPAVLLATSPGSRGAASVLKTATESAPYFGMEVKASISVPSFNSNFDSQQQTITNNDLAETIDKALRLLVQQ